MTLRRRTLRWPILHLMPIFAILFIAAAPAAAALELTCQTSSEIAEIGQDLVLVVTVRATDTSALVEDGITVTVTPPDDVFGEPYPLRALSQPVGGRYGTEAIFEWAAPVPVDAQPGEHEIAVSVDVTTGEKTETVTWSDTIRIDYGEGWSADRIANFIEQRGLAVFLVVVFGFGLLMSLSPCIYPMIPITLAVIGTQSQEKGALHGLGLSVTYALGMALVYAIVGALSALVFSGITAFMQSPYVVGPIALLFIVLAFGMFGAYELQAPQTMRDKLSGPGGGSRAGLLGVFVMGMVAGLVASPCVGPFLLALLTWVGTTGDPVLGFVSLFTFGIGMSMLLIGVGTFPALLGQLPQAGGWMENVNKGMGLLLIAMAFYFVRPSIFVPEHIFYPLLGGVMIVVAVFLGAFDHFAADVHWWERARKGIGLIVLVAGVYLLGGSFLKNGFLMPSPLAGRLAGPQTTAVVPGPVSAEAQNDVAAAPLPAKVPWQVVHTGENVQTFLDEQAAAAKAAGKPMMIDFWATWCVYCKKLDKLVWNVPEIVAESQRFVTIKVDATAPDDAEMTAIKDRWDVAGLPRVVFIDSRGEYLPGRSTGWQEPDKMLEIMKSIR